MTEFNFEAVEASPNSELFCEEPGCEKRLVYSGRGRKPKRCDEHKKTSKPRTTTTRKTQKTGVDYRPGIMGILQLPAAVLAVGGVNKPELAADAATLTIHSPNVAESLNELAKERPEVAAVLDRILSVGPYGLVIAAVAPMALQILANHDVVPSGVMGTVPKEALLQHMQEQAHNHEEQLKAAMANGATI